MSRDPYKYFRVEARELLEQLGTGVIELERGSPSADLVPRLLRLTHTLKGAARVVKLPGIADLAHSIEDALAPFRDRPAGASRETVDAILKQFDAISSQVAALAPPPLEGETAAAARAQTEGPLRTIRADVAEMDDLLDGVAVASAQFGSMRRAIGSVEHARHVGDLLVEQLEAARPGGVRARSEAALSKARSLAEELRSVVAGLERTLSGSLDRFEREMRQVREATERLRLVPASAVLAPLERVARDSAQAVGRGVRFESRGGDVRLDAHVLGIVQGALIQLVRNAIAHGIEPESERSRSGKPAVGLVTLDVARRGNRVAFVCADDGRGVDLEAVRRLAHEKGLLVGKVEKYGVEDLVRLLLQGGLTTSGEVTHVAGRGVGLDVVREAAARLGGDVAVRTDAQRGTAVELVVPVSMASLEALLVEASGQTCAIPLDAVRKALRLRTVDLMRTADGEAILYEGNLIPFVPLTRLLPSTLRPQGSPTVWSAVVVGATPQFAAVGVDRLLGTANVVLRPLPALAPADAVVAGASLDAEGNPQIVLDPDRLVSAVRALGPTPIPADSPSRQPILVIDDSLTTRMLEQSILESAGYEVDLASSAEEGFEKALRRRYGLFLVDVEMPGMDGFTFVERAGVDPALRDVPSILVTSRGDPEDRRRGMEAGAVAYIVKSDFDQAALVETIRQLVR